MCAFIWGEGGVEGGGGLRALRGVTRGGGVGGRRAKDLITDAEGYDV